MVRDRVRPVPPPQADSERPMTELIAHCKRCDRASWSGRNPTCPDCGGPTEDLPPAMVVINLLARIALRLEGRM